MNSKNSVFARMAKDLEENPNHHQKWFPEFFDPNTHKVKILFVAPRFDAYGYYQQIIPGLLFNRKAGKFICSCLTMLAKSKEELDCQIDEQYTMLEEHVRLSDIIVFPFVEQDLTGLYKAIRKIKESVVICTTVDYDYYNVPKSHYKYDLLKDPEAIRRIEANLYYSDKIFIQNMNFLPVLAEKLGGKFTIKRKVPIDHIPFMLSGKNYENINFSKQPELKKKPGVTRVGVISYGHTKDDYLELRSYLEWLLKNNKHFEVYVFGNDFKKPQRGKLPAGRKVKVPTKIIKPDGWLYYYKDLYNLNLDALIVHRKENDWNKNNREPHEILDASFFQIPIITNIHSGYLVPDLYWHYDGLAEFKSIIKDLKSIPDVFKHKAQASRDYVLKYHSIDPDGVRIKELESLYLSFESENDVPVQPANTESDTPDV